MKKDNPKMTKSIPKKQSRTQKDQTNRNTQNKKSRNREDNESKECRHKRHVGPKKGSLPNTKKNKTTTNKKQQIISYSFQEHQTKNKFCGRKKSTKEKNNDFLKGHFRKDPPEANKMSYLVFLFFSFSSARGGPGEKKKQTTRKRRNKEKTHNSKKNQTGYTQRRRK